MDKDDEFICNICNKSETNASEILTCMYCFTSVHFKCKNIYGVAKRRMRETDYFCTSDCSVIYQKIIMMQNSNHSLMSSLAAEMKAAISASVARELQTVTTNMKLITTAIERSQEFLSAKFDEIVTDFNEIKLENERMKAEIEQLKKSQNNLQGSVHKLEANADKTDKAALANNAVVWGVPSAPDENVAQLVEKFLGTLGLGENCGLVTSAERMFSNNKVNNAVSPIRISFTDVESKEVVFNKKKQYGKFISTMIDSKLLINGKATNVTLRDELTPLALELLKELRESQEILDVKYIWAGRGGVVFIKKDENSKPELVRNREDLSRVMSHFVRTAHVVTSGNTPSPKRMKSAH